MKRILLIVGLLAALLSLQAEAATAGIFQFVAGVVKVVSVEGNERFARKGMEIYEGEGVVTSATASAQIKMADDGLIVVRPDTKLRITTFVFHGKADGSERSLISLVKGGFRAITGVIGRFNKANYKIETPSATIGIRGTDHEPTFIPNPLPGKVAIAEPGTYDKVNAGAAVLSTAKGMVVINPNQAGFVPNIPNALPALLAKIPAFYQMAPSQDEPKVVPQAGASLKSDAGSASTQSSTSDGTTNTTGTTASTVKTGTTTQAVATDATLTGGTAAPTSPTTTTSKTAISNIQTGATVLSTPLTTNASVSGTTVIPLASSALIMNTTPTVASPATIPIVTKVAPIAISPAVSVIAPTVTTISPAVAPTTTLIAPVVAPTVTKIAPVTISPAVSVIAPTMTTIAPAVAPTATLIAPVVAPTVTTIAPVTAPTATVIAPIAAPTTFKVAPITTFSDRRLKKNIKRIGTHRLGIGIYEFDYIWGEHAIGVMADEVKQVMPEAVIRDPSGYDMVDYGKLN